MLTFAELATFLETSARRVRPELKLETQELLDDAATEAKALIGQELDEWVPLAESTIKQKQALGFGGQVSETDPLLRTGQLRDSIKAETEETGEGVDGVLGSEDQVALFQELGTSRVPPRPFLAPSVVSAQARSENALGEIAMTLLIPAVR